MHITKEEKDLQQIVYLTMCPLLYNIKNDMGMGKWWSKKEGSQKWHN